MGDRSPPTATAVSTASNPAGGGGLNGGGWRQRLAHGLALRTQGEQEIARAVAEAVASDEAGAVAAELEHLVPLGEGRHDALLEGLVERLRPGLDAPVTAALPRCWWRDDDPHYVRAAELCLQYYKGVQEQGRVVTRHPTMPDVSALWADDEKLPVHQHRDRLVSDRLLTAHRRTGRRQRFTDARNDAYARFLAEGGVGAIEARVVSES